MICFSAIYELNLKNILTHIIDFDEVPEYMALLSEHPEHYVKVIARLT